MLTSRAGWFLSGVLLILGLGLWRPSLPLTLVGLTLLLWFGCQGLLSSSACRDCAGCASHGAQRRQEPFRIERGS
jgi:hypothetical protein